MQFGVTLFERRMDLPVARWEVPRAIFVADFYPFQTKRFGVPVLGAQFSPDRGGVAVGIFDGIQKIRHDPAHLFHRHVLDLAEHAGFSGESDVEWLGASVLAKLQIFLEAHAVSSAIIPRPPALFTLFEWT